MREYRRESQKARRERNPEHVREVNRIWREANIDSVRRQNRSRLLMKKYGLTLEAYEALVENQGGLCAICQRQRTLVVDHCHKTGPVRGLLCARCNTGIGQFYDDEATLMRAARYVSRHAAYVPHSEPAAT